MVHQEQKTITFDCRPGYTFRLTLGHPDFGENWISMECLDENFNVVPGVNGGFRGPGVHQPQPAGLTPEPEPEQNEA
ncbi:hypothetical protein BH766_gp30 [Gordonia phage Demosthenes]|uniref:Uncharacterized protein n=2 Tax=Demosthenesvirus demosthenes TaxID=1982107 RepID=A0A5J6TFK3_9CAUD|nr:hypothetical protein BH766_gp30 [Gordonia phage Demosthenes]ANA86000.1 hypothetical protein PBI_DEMOSTHENES_30 [Gordonia phage Demosthenes]QFG08517.1 hypothetical protein PBI_ASERPROCKY_30 [Gordonia phage ASerpRocky]